MCLAVPGKVLEIVGEDPLLRAAKVSFAGVVKLISLTCTPEAKVGDFVLVHVGVAISVVDAKEAAETFSYLQQMGELDGLEIPPGAALAREARPMKYVDEYRDAALVRKLAAAIARATTRPWTIMEICGGQTHAIVKFGLDDLLPKNITLVHGPGCPVCVTSADLIDQAVDLALNHGVILCSFGDMLRVPGNGIDLLTAKARGGDVRIVYSPLDAVSLARDNPARQVVFFAVGFETTAPANALSVQSAAAQGVKNYSILTSHVLVPPAMRAILGSPDNRVQGFLAAGHVCTIMGTSEYGPIAREYGAPIIITGFEPVDILEGILLCVKQLESGRAEMENAYARAVRAEGNQHARRIVEDVFEVCDRDWRGIGVIPRSGLAVRAAYAAYDAAARFPLKKSCATCATECISGEIMRGVKKPHDCPAFGTRCTPERPLGAPMVSSEGACAAYYRYRSRVLLPA